MDIFYFFAKSAKRREELREFQEFCEIEQSKIIKHVTTRWLSLINVIKRTVAQWTALKSYFESHPDVEKEGSKVHVIFKNLDNPVMLLTMKALLVLLPDFVNFNLLYQQEQLNIHRLHESVLSLLKDILAKFVRPEILARTDIL